MIWIVYNDCFGGDAAVRAGAAAAASGTQAERIVRKADFFGRLLEIGKLGGRIDEFRLFGRFGPYGPFFGFPGWVEPAGVSDWKPAGFPFAEGASAHFYGGNAEAWFAPFFARLYGVTCFVHDADKTTRVAVPEPGTSGAAYDPVAELYDKTFEDFSVRKDEWAWIKRRFAEIPQASVLEIGCGNGSLLRLLSGSIRHGSGADVSGGLIAKASAESAGVPNLDFKQIDSHRLPYPDSSFEAVMSVLSFRYLDWDPLLEEVRRVLKPGGRLLVVDMSADKPSPAEWPRVVLDKLKASVFELFRPAFRKALRALVAHPGWKKMLAGNPMRTCTEYREYLESRFPGRKLQTLNVGRRSRVFCFDSGPLDKPEPCPELAVMDWGIGGLSFLKLFRERHPGVPVLYLSDSGSVPYGKQSAASLAARLRSVAAYLAGKGVAKLVVACNAMSTAIGDFLSRYPATGMEVTGVIVPAMQRLLASRPEGGECVGVIGGRRTIESGAYVLPLRDGGYAVEARVAQPLSAMIERGDTGSEIFRKTLADVLAPLRKCDYLIAGCTHYTAAMPVIRELCPGPVVIDPSAETLDWIDGNWKLKNAAGRDVFLTTGDPVNSREAALKAFGFETGGFAKVVVPDVEG